MKEITVKLLKIIKRTFRNTTCSKTFRFHFTAHYKIISIASKMAD